MSLIERAFAMRTKSTELMQRISGFIDRYYSERHTTPSVREIAEGVNISKTASYRYLVEMDERGMLEYDGTSRTIITPMIRKFSAGTVAAPVVGVVPCGTPEEEEENIQEYVSLPVSLFGRGEFYILKASGDSMVDAGIMDGDMVVIRKQTEARVGDIVVALDENGTNTLKKYGGIDPETNMALLLYQNREMYPDKKILVHQLVVQGVAKHVIRAL